MTRGRARVHFASDKPDRALCGWTFVDLTADVSTATCKACLAIFAAGRQAPASTRQAGKTNVKAAEVTGALVDAFVATLAPCAGAPPRLTPQLWNASCKGGEWPCRNCELCAWQAEAERWGSREVAAWNRTMRVHRDASAPRWGSLTAALRAYAEHESHDRAISSGLGVAMDRMKRGDADGQRDPRRTSREIRSAEDSVQIGTALARAYPEGGHPTLTSEQCRAILLARTPGVLSELPTYEELAEDLLTTDGVLRAVVKHGRSSMTKDLVERGLIPAPRSIPMVAASLQVMYEP